MLDLVRYPQHHEDAPEQADDAPHDNTLLGWHDEEVEKTDGGPDACSGFCQWPEFLVERQ